MHTGRIFLIRLYSLSADNLENRNGGFPGGMEKAEDPRWLSKSCSTPERSLISQEVTGLFCKTTICPSSHHDGEWRENLSASIEIITI